MARVKVRCPNCTYEEVIEAGDARTSDPDWTPFCPNDKTPMVIVSTPDAPPSAPPEPDPDRMTLVQQIEKLQELERLCAECERDMQRAQDTAKKRKKSFDEAVARLRSFVAKLASPTVLPLFDGDQDDEESPRAAADASEPEPELSDVPAPPEGTGAPGALAGRHH